MAKVTLDQLLWHLRGPVAAALQDALQEALNVTTADPEKLFNAFGNALQHRCPGWQEVPNKWVKDR
jgi:hypothetical protein